MMSVPTHLSPQLKLGTIVFIIDGAERLVNKRDKMFDFVQQTVNEVPDGMNVGVLIANDELEWPKPLNSPIQQPFPKDNDKFATKPGHFVTAVNKVADYLTQGDKLVLVTDGRSDRHALLASAWVLRQKEIETYIYPVVAEGRTGIFIENITGPVLIREGDEATFRVALQNLNADAAQLDIAFKLLEDKSKSPVSLPPLKGFRCEPGRCVAEYNVLFSRPCNAWVGVALQKIDRSGPFKDLHKAWFSTIVQPTPEILVVAGLPGAADLVMESLRARGAEISGRRLFEINPSQFPSDVNRLKRYGVIVFVNVEASALTKTQTDALRHYVEEMGGGLVAFGGIQAFDHGGYAGSEFEKLLPVDSQPKPPKPKKLTFGLLFVIDISGSISGLLGETKASIKKLIQSVPLDSTVGIILFDAAAKIDKQLTRLNTREERKQLLNYIYSLSAGGGTSLDTGLVAAVSEITRFKKKAPSNHPGGHVIILSDGHLENGGGNNPELEQLRDFSKKLASKGWQVSCVGIGDGLDGYTLAEIAQAGGGSYSAYPLIPKISKKDDPNAQLSYTLSTTPGELVFRLNDHEPMPLASVIEFNRVKNLKQWARESLRFDHNASPWGLVFGELGRGRSVAVLYDVTSAWSFPLLESSYRDTLLARPVLFALQAKTDELHVPSLQQNEDGRWTLIVGTTDDMASKIDVRLGYPFAKKNVPISLELARTEQHVYSALLPMNTKLSDVLLVENDTQRIQVPVTPRPFVDVDALKGSGHDLKTIQQFLQIAKGAIIDTPNNIIEKMTPPLIPDTRRFWSPFLAAAIVLAVAADAAVRTWRILWPSVFYLFALIFIIIAIVMEGS